MTSTWWRILSRRKRLDPASSANGHEDGSQLARVLTTFDLTALGVGSTLGVGVYVLAGHVAKDTAGPSVVLSFLIAAVASVFAGLCYAEFGARVPKAGSAYIYSYVCVGEFIAFIIGWNLILEYVIGSASVAKGLSLYLDTLLNNTLKDTFREIAPIHSSFMSEYFDFFSFGITILLGGALAFGMKESSLVNNIFTIVNLAVVIFVIIAGSFKADAKNWSIKKEDIPSGVDGGVGGFFPFGIAGTIKGAATCFYGFVGFDCIATTGEEVKNPQRAIPISIILSLFIIFLSYFGTSAIVTLMYPYYLQDPNAPIPHAFAELGWDWAKWVVSIGGICGLFASLFGAMFPLPRIIYAMATDALIFRFLGNVDSRFRTPVVGTLLAALLTGLMSALFDLKQLVNMMSIGTLMAYTIVAACVIILRYSIDEDEIAEWRYSLLLADPDSDYEYDQEGQSFINNTEDQENLHLIPPGQDSTIGSVLKQMFNFTKRTPTYLTQRLVTIEVFIFSLLSLIFALLLTYLQTNISNGDLYAVIPTAIIGLLMVMTLTSIYAQPSVNAILSFKVPLVPLIPALSICINLYLMMMLDANTWIRFGVWMAIGLPIYFACCKLYKIIPNTPAKSSLLHHTNGNINTGYENTENGNITQNGSLLTIPTIVVNPPTITEEVETQRSSTETNNIGFNRDRKESIDSTEINDVFTAFDKVLDDSDRNSTTSYEAVNPDNPYRNSAILTRNLDNSSIGSFKSSNQIEVASICSTDSESVQSEEHHIEADVHQEDFDEDPEDEIKNEEKYLKEDKVGVEKQTEDIIPGEDSEEIKQEEINEKDSKFEEKHIEADVHQKDLDGDSEDKMKNEELQKEKVGIEKQSDDTISKEMKQKETSAEDSKIEDEKKEAGFIPAPPPMSGLNIPPVDIVSSNPTKIRRPPPLVTQSNLTNVELKPIPTARKRTVSVTSEGPTENVRPGSEQFNKLKFKLETLLKNPKPNPNLLMTQPIPDKSPSPTIEKEIALMDNMLEEYDSDIPNDFGKSKEFKNTLNNLLLRKHSKNSIKSEEYVRKYEKNNQNATKSDEAKHKTKMADTLRSIKLRKTGLLGIDEQNQSDDDNDKDSGNKNEEQNKTDAKEDTKNTVKSPQNDENDLEKHKEMMIRTLRSIKLRRTGLLLDEETKNEDESKKDNTPNT